MINHGSIRACQDAALDQLVECFEKPCWMAITCTLVDGVLTIHETTHEFPHSSHEKALNLLSGMLDTKAGRVKHEALPTADIVGELEASEATITE